MKIANPLPKIVISIRNLPARSVVFIKNLPSRLKNAYRAAIHIGGFILLLNVYLISKVIIRLTQFPRFPKRLVQLFGPALTTVYNRALQLNKEQSNTINRFNLIDLAIRNMRFKKSRTTITVGGMALGIGAIVFLVSIGYGLQNLVIGRIARLDEMRQADITRQTGGQAKINDKTIADFQQIQNVNLALPLIAVVGRVNYQNSVSDMAVYGVTSEYLRQSAIKPIHGDIFQSNDLTLNIPSEEERLQVLKSENLPTVAGSQTDESYGEFGQKVAQINFSILPDTWLKVRSGPSVNSPVIGYTRRSGDNLPATRVWGGKYTDEDGFGQAGFDYLGQPLGFWIQAEFPIWNHESCPSADPECYDGSYRIAYNQNGIQLYRAGFVAQIQTQVTVLEPTPPQVLGESTFSQSAIEEMILGEETATSSSQSIDGIDWIEIASESGILETPQVKTLPLPASAKREAVVNIAMLRILGIKDTEAVGKTFSTSFVVVEDLLEDSKQKVESEVAEYTIVGVIPDDKSPVFYVPFIDLRGLGITNYSQVKVVGKNQTDLGRIRSSIEAMGYSTQSVADTVNQINSLFNTVRTVLALLGMVALAVASLGMFNTLTISLLERTREVGLMKAMGMKSGEVQELFLTESMIMGFFGGLLGITFGFVSGKLLSLLLSAFSVSKGVGVIDVSYIPIGFVILIVVLSLTVGLLTGIYPARRATKISALNALRYE